MSEIAEEIRKRDDFVVVHHYDADGCSSGAIMFSCLKRLGKKVSRMWIKQLYRENIPEIKGLGKNHVFCDFGSGQLEYLKESFGENLFVFDHHQKTSFQHPNHFSPFDYGINGGNEISASGIAYLFAKTLDSKNIDLVPLALVGAVGDVQDYNGKFEGLNAKIAEEGAKSGFVKIEKDLRLYGRVSRPLVQFLMYSTSPMLPEITANEENAKKFLVENSIALKNGGQWRTYIDLAEQEKKNLATALILHLGKFNVPEWKIKELFGEVYSFPREEIHSPTSEAKEFSTLLNACGRNGRADIAIEVCLGDRKEKFAEAMALMQEHRRQLRQGIEYVTKNGVKEEEQYYYFDAGKEIKESIVGIVAGMLYGSGIVQTTKPIIAIALNEDGSLKISGRATKELVRQGLNLGNAFREVCSQFGEGNEGGGHCLHPETLVQKENGVIAPIKEITGGDIVLSSTGTSLANSCCKAAFANEKEKIVSIKTVLFEIKSSEDHRFFKFENFGITEAKAGNLKAGDFILGLKKINFKGMDVALSNDPHVYLKEAGILRLKAARVKHGFTRNQLLAQSATMQKIHHFADLENLYSHRILESRLVELLGMFCIPKKKFLDKFAEKKFECKAEILNDSLAWLAGYIQGDGYIDKKRIECKEPDLAIISYFKEVIRENFGLGVQVIDEGSYKKIRAYSADLCRFMKLNFPETALLSGSLRAPEKIMVTKNEVLACYIRGLFDADGGAYARFVHLDMVDERLLRTVQLLLLRFGIKSNVRETKSQKQAKWNKRKSYRLDVTDFYSLKLFNEKIGFTQNSKKQFKLATIIQKQSVKKRNTAFLSPFTYKQMRRFIIDNAIPRGIFDYGILYSRTGSKRMGFHMLEKNYLEPMLNNRVRIGETAVQKILFLSGFLQSEFLTFYEIKGKTVSENTLPLIDLSIPETKNFVANGLVVHNSIAAGLKLEEKNKEEFLLKLNEKIKEQLRKTG